MSDYLSEHFINRELSWLAFNERVLEEAEDASCPPLNQLAFLAIVSSNLDEFVMVRLASLLRAVQRGGAGECPAGLTPAEQVERVVAAMRRMVARQYACFTEKVWPELTRRGLRRLDPHELTSEQLAHVRAVFEEQIFPLLTPLAIDAERRFTGVPDLTINVLVRLSEGEEDAETRGKEDAETPGHRDAGTKEERPPAVVPASPRPRVPASSLGSPEHIAVVAIPNSLPRMVVVPAEGEHGFLLVEDVVRMFLGRLFAGHEIRATALFRVTRDADLSVEESKDEDFLAAMSDVLIQRRLSRVIRLELAEESFAWAAGLLGPMFDVRAEEVFQIPGPLDLKAFWSLVNLPGLAHLRYGPWRPQPVPELGGEVDVWEAIRRGDILLHHPYETFDVVVRLLQEAAADRNVLAIKQVLYRTSGSSKIIAALEQAAINGKQVSVLVELKARFDEARNIEWARRLERAGVQVVYGLAGLKVHAKALMIVRREPDRIRRYVHLATGNYNEVTAQLYTDFGLLTCDEDFGSDVAAFFNMVTGFSLPVGWRKLAVAPRGLRQRLLHLIRREIERAKAGQQAAILLKLNSLSDQEMIEALYDASRAGVKIRLNVRGVCGLRPGVPGVSENIEVVSIVGRFLEHGRVLYFRNGGGSQEELYLSSADWMPRNLDRRIELLFPVESAPLKKRLIDALEIMLADSAKGRRLNADGRYTRLSPGDQQAESQTVFMQRAESAARKLAEQTPRDFVVIKPPDRQG
jgi:polyphosphate kinase